MTTLGFQLQTDQMVTQHKHLNYEYFLPNL